MTEEDVKLIKTREIGEFEYTGREPNCKESRPPLLASWLFYKNEDYERFNRKVHEVLPTEGAVSTARICFDVHIKYQ